MTWRGHSFSGCPDSVSLLGLPSPLLFSLLSFEEERHHSPDLRSPVSAQAVVKQPTRGASARTVVTAIVPTGGDWSTGLFSVCRDRKICFCGLFCPMCLECDIARHYGECLCWPLLPGSTFALRIGTRERHKIQGTLCEDWLAVHCCWPCSICQVARELKMRTSQLYEICEVPSTKDTLV
ncbi:PLAC8-like protein 1 [Perognathus longimembris pacificus]|uniref:PLAC8-like protein 1 n=1 Tax=Perognathus longimembris pacificus TaxID=214514 RepID=UPI002018A0CF|nr:PLAC8-like protein 1 [Perognathus longimembris pacificus]